MRSDITNFFEIIILNVILIIFPLLIYLFYIAYEQNVDEKINELFLDFMLFTSLYSVLRFGVFQSNFNYLILTNIPLLIAFYKKRNIVSILISIVIIYNGTINFNLNIYWILLEYSLFYLIYLLNEKSNFKILVYSFIFIKLVFIYIFYFNNYNKLIENLLSIITFYIIYNIIILILLKGEEILKLHMSIKELEQEKQFRLSLFKITHEIKNPIAVCKNYLDMYDYSNEDHQRFIPIIKEEIEKTLLLLQDFLCMTKINIEPEILDISLLLDEAINSLKPILSAKRIELKTNILDDEIYINGDYNRLNQVLINIIKNSIEAIENNGIINIFTVIKDKNVEIVFSDNGIGMNQELLKKIKEPFYTTKKNGTGLGVSLSYEIIEAHHGKIEYESEEYKGTKVTISLPVLDYFASI